MKIAGLSAVGLSSAANAGGAWSPIGDVTTTMLWIGGQVTTLTLIKHLILPSIVCLAVTLACLSLFLKGTLPSEPLAGDEKRAPPPGSRAVVLLGLGALVGVPIFKMLTGLPPFMGMFFGWSLLWLFTDWLHGHDEERAYLRMHRIFQRLDLTSLFFFCGILLAVAALESAGILHMLARGLEAHVSSYALLATLHRL